MRIEVDGESLASLASLLRTRSNEVTELAAQLSQACTAAGGGIGGTKAAAAFQEMQTGWSGHLGKISAALANVAAALETARLAYTEADTGSIPNGAR